MKYTFDLKNGPVVEFSESVTLPSEAEAHRYARTLASSARKLWQDADDWLVEICDHRDFVIETVMVADARAEPAPATRRAA